MPARHIYVRTLQQLPSLGTAVPSDALRLSQPRPTDADALAELMLDAYHGTIDYDGETLADARAELAGYLSSSPAPLLAGTTMPRKPSQHPRQRRYDPLMVLSYVFSYQQRPGRRSPSERRIQVDLGISAPSVVHNLLQRLARQGLLTITPYERGQVSDLTLTEAGHAAVERWRQDGAAGGSRSASGEQ